MKTVIAGTIVRGHSGGHYMVVFFTELSTQDLVELIFLVIVLGIGEVGGSTIFDKNTSTHNFKTPHDLTGVRALPRTSCSASWNSNRPAP